jgi:hypothetical protein
MRAEPCDFFSTTREEQGAVHSNDLSWKWTPTRLQQRSERALHAQPGLPNQFMVRSCEIRRVASSIRKVEPLPKIDSTQIRPPT